VHSWLRSLAICALLGMAGGLAHAQYRAGAAMLLVAEPGLRDADYAQTVIIAAPAPWPVTSPTKSTILSPRASA